ncbi:NAD(P)/FAD-dependent oxidoreductase [Salinibacterium sp. ZJ454]|uniref:phytoene desaturase family protein n=1 Tax=Salinibacterium sp. ZJ454 TaxID=2708339 RepID=UPI00141F929F|nr:NAD(P)/FAD-dependent oxidoreductase [Salinibacterium sp. ZJ454]
MIDVTVVGSGPNGLAAAVTMARAGLSVHLLERADTIGGGLRSAEVTMPGYLSDVCSAVHPAALASPFFRAFELRERVRFLVPKVSYAHPLDHGRAGIAWRDLDRTAAGLGVDGRAWRRLFRPLVDSLGGVVDFTGSQLLRMPHDPIAAARYALRVLEYGSGLGRHIRFRDDVAPAMLAGVAAHAAALIPSLSAAGAGLLLATHAHAHGWGYPRGGSQAIADALAADLLEHGGRIETGVNVQRLDDLEPSKVVLLDTSVRFLAAFAPLPRRYLRQLQNYRYGAAIAKVDFAVNAPVPWSNPDVRHAPTVHVGGSRREIAQAENAVRRGRHPMRPYVLLTQQSVLDDSRAPEGHQVLWAYTHVPLGSSVDATRVITEQIERFAPGFRDTVIVSVPTTAARLAEYNPNDVGGDILGGQVNLRQLVQRPVLSTKPWRTPIPGVYLCSAATPPGPAVHGMNGWYAARLALRDVFGITQPPRLGIGE